ncbi:hypothetical protein B0H16DRAFT_761270 [Mycena metata]|uniref:Secreted protein n=1 Tax=Mycena metata TaxID=1033252 RepID=A0AAD7NC90_9AGAR|nr:hypothetical protein B0H16DRAFT_761270 [Mycena metata]
MLLSLLALWTATNLALYGLSAPDNHIPAALRTWRSNVAPTLKKQITGYVNMSLVFRAFNASTIPSNSQDTIFASASEEISTTPSPSVPLSHYLLQTQVRGQVATGGSCGRMCAVHGSFRAPIRVPILGLLATRATSPARSVG